MTRPGRDTIVSDLKPDKSGDCQDIYIVETNVVCTPLTAVYEAASCFSFKSLANCRNHLFLTHISYVLSSPFTTTAQNSALGGGI